MKDIPKVVELLRCAVINCDNIKALGPKMLEFVKVQINEAIEILDADDRSLIEPSGEKAKTIIEKDSGPRQRCSGCGRQAADDPTFPDDYCVKCWPDHKALLRDKLQSWPGDMALSSDDIADLFALIESSGEKDKGKAMFPCACCDKPSVRYCPDRGAWVCDEHAFTPAPSPAPTIKQDLRVGPSVEEAMERVEVWYRHYDLEKLVGQMGGYAKQDAAALAVIRAALAKGVEWERKWAELVETVASRTDQARTMEVKP